MCGVYHPNPTQLLATGGPVAVHATPKDQLSYAQARAGRWIQLVLCSTCTSVVVERLEWPRKGGSRTVPNRARKGVMDRSSSSLAEESASLHQKNGRESATVADETEDTRARLVASTLFYHCNDAPRRTKDGDARRRRCVPGPRSCPLFRICEKAGVRLSAFVQ